MLTLAAFVLLSGCAQPAPQAQNNNGPANNGPAIVCPQGIEVKISKIEFGPAETNFLTTDSIYPTVTSSVACDKLVTVSLSWRVTPRGLSSFAVEQSYNIPAGTTGYKDYNPQKNLDAGAYAFDFSYDGAVFKTIDITVSAPPQPPADNNSGNAGGTNSGLSEQPNAEKFSEYFTEISLGKLPLGVQVGPPLNFPQKTTVFTSVDQFCTDMLIKKTVPANTASSSIFDVDKNEYAVPKLGTFPMELKEGGSDGCEPLPVPKGNYEYKIYVDDVLVTVLPFEVQ